MPKEMRSQESSDQLLNLLKGMGVDVDSKEEEVVLSVLRELPDNATLELVIERLSVKDDMQHVIDTITPFAKQNQYGNLFNNSVEKLPFGEDGKAFYIDLSILNGEPSLIVNILNLIPKNTFHLARFIANEQTLDIIQDKLPGWYAKLRTHAIENQ